MEIALLIGVIITFLIALYLFLIAPGAPKNIEKYRRVKFAHRGLHDSEKSENSMSAFRAAVERGYGIELDVRLSSDNVLVVFHDDTLNRVVGIDGRVDAFTYKELSKMHLSGKEDTIPSFSEVLRLVGGRVPLLVEIKEDAGNSAVSTAVAEMLKSYSGDYIVESFNPFSVANVKKALPDVAVGILSQKFLRDKKYRKPSYFLLGALLLNFICRPAFIAYNHEHHSSLSLKIARRIFRAPIFAWTVRSEEEEKKAKKNGFEAIIFEGYKSEK